MWWAKPSSEDAVKVAVDSGWLSYVEDADCTDTRFGQSVDQTKPACYRAAPDEPDNNWVVKSTAPRRFADVALSSASTARGLYVAYQYARTQSRQYLFERRDLTSFFAGAYEENDFALAPLLMRVNYHIAHAVLDPLSAAAHERREGRLVYSAAFLQERFPTRVDLKRVLRAFLADRLGESLPALLRELQWPEMLDVLRGDSRAGVRTGNEYREPTYRQLLGLSENLFRFRNSPRGRFLWRYMADERTVVHAKVRAPRLVTSRIELSLAKRKAAQAARAAREAAGEAEFAAARARMKAVGDRQEAEWKAAQAAREAQQKECVVM